MSENVENELVKKVKQYATSEKFSRAIVVCALLLEEELSYFR